MKQLSIMIIFILCSFTFSVSAEEPKTVSNEMLLEKIELYQKLNDTKFEIVFNEIKNLRDDMNKRFEQVDKRFEQVDKRFEQVDKRFEQVDKRFEQVDKRFEFNQQLIMFLLTLTVATPVGIEIWRKKQNKQKQVNHKEFDTLSAIISELSKSDERIKSAIRYVKEKGMRLPENMAYAI